MLLKEVEKAYTAGIIHGEGTITLTRRHKNQTPSPQISVSSTSLELLKWLKATVGSGRIIPKKKYKRHHRQSYTWYLDSTSKVIDLLNEIKDYLVLKRQQAVLIADNYRSVTPRNGRYTAEMYRRKIRLVEQVQRLNRQQIYAPHNTPGSPKKGMKR